MKKNYIMAALLAITPMIGVAHAENPIWAEMDGDWTIRVDQVNDCYAYKGDSRMMVSLDTAYSLGVGEMMSLFSTDWPSIQTDKQYDIEVHLQNTWDIVAIGTVANEQVKGITFLISDPEFLEEFMRASKISAYYDGTHLGTIPLSGSMDVAVAIFDCQEEINKNNNKNVDPFHRDSDDIKTSTDPFEKDA